MKKERLEHLKVLYKHVSYYNKLGPFPSYDSSWVEDIKKLIKEMEEDNKRDYDSEPVVACKYCKSLHIITDEDVNNICMRCGSVNEITEFENIYKYNDFLNDKKDS